MPVDPTLPRKPISELKPGEMVDLEGDQFADHGNHPEFEFELQTVYEVEFETADCTVVHFNSGLSVGFPTDHTLPYQPE